MILSSIVWDAPDTDPNKTVIKHKKTQAPKQKLRGSSKAERRKWSREEDKQLNVFISKHGTSNWKLAASMYQDRTAKQCRERWINHLDPAIVKGKLSQEEWDTVVHAQEEFGKQMVRNSKITSRPNS